MPAESLRCRICEAEYPAVASGMCVRCFGPLEPVYDWDAISLTREDVARGPRSLDSSAWSTATALSWLCGVIACRRRSINPCSWWCSPDM